MKNPEIEVGCFKAMSKIRINPLTIFLLNNCLYDVLIRTLAKHLAVHLRFISF